MPQLPSCTRDEVEHAGEERGGGLAATHQLKRIVKGTKTVRDVPSSFPSFLASRCR